MNKGVQENILGGKKITFFWTCGSGSNQPNKLHFVPLLCLSGRSRDQRHLTSPNHPVMKVTLTAGNRSNLMNDGSLRLGAKLWSHLNGSVQPAVNNSLGNNAALLSFIKLWRLC